MIRFAIPPIGGKGWFGGWMYMRNMVRALAEFGDPAIETMLFIGCDRADDPHIRDLELLPRTRLVIDSAFDEGNVRSAVLRTLATGRNAALLDAYARSDVSVAFAPATYLGWRSKIPSIAWFPDFQHRHLPHMFGRAAWWKREVGFRAQVAASDAILLSSASAERDALAYYPATRGHTRVARFAVPIDGWPDADTAQGQLSRAGIPSDYIFLPNQLWQHKNHMLAVEAAGVLARRGSTRTILVTGHGDDPRRPGYRTELVERIAALGAEQHIRLLGSVDHGLVKAMMIGANALLNPSLFEGWSTTVEEAKAVGTPLLLSDLEVHREQAPGARFFGTDDAEALAEAIEASPPRPLKTIRQAVADAAAEVPIRQREFAGSLSNVILEVARGQTPKAP